MPIGSIKDLRPQNTKIRYAVILAWFCPCFGQSFIFSARHQLDTWTLTPPSPQPPWYTCYGVILWVLRVLGLSQCARIFFIRFYSGCYAILTSPKKGENSCLWLQSRSVFGSVGVVLMSSKLTFTWYDQHSEHCSILLATFNMSNILKLQSS